jgi:hypothetical protein
MTIIYSEDGTTVTQRFDEQPELHWVERENSVGRFIAAGTWNGYFPLIEIERPSVDHSLTVVRYGDTFTEQWKFDRKLADRRIQAEVDEAKRFDQLKAAEDQNARIRNISAATALHLGNKKPKYKELLAHIDQLTILMLELADNQTTEPTQP